NLYLSVFLNGIAEMLAFALTAALLNKLGRKAMLVSTMLLNGAACILGSMISAFIHRRSNVDDSRMGFLIDAQLACSLMGIFDMAGTYNLLYIYTSELFPMVVRNATLGFTSQARHIGALIAPLVRVPAPCIIQVQELREEESWQLFYLHAFQYSDGILPTNIDEETTRLVFNERGGLPLALKVIGQ
ncbi:hypothetical protein KI387_018246, partial [Taxus chinensis]